MQLRVTERVSVVKPELFAGDAETLGSVRDTALYTTAIPVLPTVPEILPPETVKVPAVPSEPTLTGWSAKLNPSTVNVNENLAPGQLTVTAVYSDGSKKDVTSQATHNFTPKSEAGAYQIAISYNGSTTYLPITVKAVKTVTGMTATCKLATATEEYEFGFDDFDVKYTYSDGSQEACLFSFNWKLKGGYHWITITDIDGKYTKELSVMAVAEGEPKLLSISAVYNKDGASSWRDVSSLDFTVTGTYDDGTVKQLTSGYSTNYDSRNETDEYFVFIIKDSTGTVSTSVNVPKK